MPNNRDDIVKSEVGAVWNKTNERGDYLSLSLDLDALLELTGGATGKVDIKAFPIAGEKTNPNAPDYRLRYYPRGNTGRPAPARTKPPVDPDDDIPM